MTDDVKASWRRFNKRMAAIPKAAKLAAKPAIIKSAKITAEKIRQAAPVSTGGLRDSIHVTEPGMTTPAYSQPGGKATARELEALITVGNEKVRYAHLVEYGTAKAPAQPYFKVTANEMTKSNVGRLERAIKKAVKDTK